MCYRILRDDGTYDHAELHVVDTYDEALAYSKEYKEGSTSHERMTIEEIPATSSAAEYLLNRATKNGEDADDVKLLRAVHEQQTPKKKAMDEKGGSDAQR